MSTTWPKLAQHWKRVFSFILLFVKNMQMANGMQCIEDLSILGEKHAWDGYYVINVQIKLFLKGYAFELYLFEFDAMPGLLIDTHRLQTDRDRFQYTKQGKFGLRLQIIY
jgi:hypothetical protein